MTEETIVSEFNEENKEIEETKQVNISKKKGSVMKMFFLILLWFIIIAFGVAFMKWQDYKNFVNKIFTIEEITVNVDKWETMWHVKNKLCNQNIVDNCTYLKIFVWQNKWKYDDIKPGSHLLKWEYTLANLLESFNTEPAQKYEKATILEWENMYDISGQVKWEHQDEIKKKLQWLVLSGGYINTLEEDFPFLKEFGKIDSLEWFLYPDTYFFKPKDNESAIFPELLIKTQLKAFEEKVWDVYSGDILSSELDPYEMITIASFLEKEARDSDQRKMIADILLKRIKAGMLFQVDISLCYGLDKPYSECTPKLIGANIQDYANDYNTRVKNNYMTKNDTIYTPTPISNPSADAIGAVLNPTKNDHYYYLHSPDGGIHYANTNREHEINKAKYLR